MSTIKTLILFVCNINRLKTSKFFLEIWNSWTCTNIILEIVSIYATANKPIHIVGSSDDFLCPCCEELFTWPELTHCGHVIDKQCLRDHDACPVCEKPIIWTVPNVKTERDVNDLKIHCINEDSGCPYICSIENMGKHIAECGFELVVCYLSQFGT